MDDVQPGSGHECVAGCLQHAGVQRGNGLDRRAAGWIEFPAIQEINIEGHASAEGRVRRVEIWIDGAPLVNLNNPPTDGDLASFQTTWTPPGVGTFTIQAIAVSADGAASAPDTARITFGEKSPVGCPSPVGGGPTPPPPCAPVPVGCPSPVGGGPTPLSLRSNAGWLPFAGWGRARHRCHACGHCQSSLSSFPERRSSSGRILLRSTQGRAPTYAGTRPNRERLVFGGIDQPMDGSYEACLCDDERYSLGVTHLDGSQEKP